MVLNRFLLAPLPPPPPHHHSFYPTPLISEILLTSTCVFATCLATRSLSLQFTKIRCLREAVAVEEMQQAVVTAADPCFGPRVLFLLAMQLSAQAASCFLFAVERGLVAQLQLASQTTMYQAATKE